MLPIKNLIQKFMSAAKEVGHVFRYYKAFLKHKSIKLGIVLLQIDRKILSGYYKGICTLCKYFYSEIYKEGIFRMKNMLLTHTTFQSPNP